MSLECILVFGYLIVGFILTFIWWHDEYKSEYELERENDGVEEPMAVLLLASLVLFWPYKVVKNYFEGFVD